MSTPLVSITILTSGIKLLKIPRTLVNEFMHPILRMLLFRSPSDPFFSITLNDIELSIFASAEFLEKVFGSLLSDSTVQEGVEISEEAWVVLQVEQHGDSDYEKSGNRVLELAQPLAAEGISILYCSTYISDFILLKAHRLEQVIHILQRQSGFTFQHTPEDGLDNLSEASSISSSERVRAWNQNETQSPITSRSLAGSLLFRDASLCGQDDNTRKSSPAASTNGGGLSRHSSLSRSTNFLTSLTLTSPQLVNDSPLPMMIEPDMSYYAEGDSIDDPALDNVPRSFEDPLKTAMPTADSSPIPSLDLASKLCCLPDELVCVGLNREYESSWRDKLVQAIFYSDDVLPPSPELSTEDSEIDDIPGYSPSVDEDLANSTEFSTNLSNSGYSMRNTSSHPSSSVKRRKPRTFADSIREGSQPHLSSNTNNACDNPTPFNHHHSERSPSTSMADHPTPFVSFTATLEGCSLTADIRLLRKLFPNDQENSVFAAGEGGLDSPWIGEEGDDIILSDSDGESPVMRNGNDEVDLPSRGRSRKRDSALSQVSQFDRMGLVDGYTSNGVDGSRRLLKCLQLDLSSFGLDKTGIVNMLTDILTSNGINLLYSSTFATANILVSKNDLSKARSTLLGRI